MLRREKLFVDELPRDVGIKFAFYVECFGWVPDVCTLQSGSIGLLNLPKS
jgi:hypothetical protein